MSERTTVIRLEQVRDAANEGTRIGAFPAATPSAGALFDAHHETMARELGRHRKRGVMLFVAGAEGLRGQAWCAITDELRTLALGRHSSCTLTLSTDRALSLRQLLVVVGRETDPWAGRVVDLSTPRGFSDDAGRLHRSLAFDRVAVLGVPSRWLFFFETGGPLPWNPRAPSPWSTLAPRVVSDVADDERLRAARFYEVQRAQGEVSRVTSFGGPISFASDDLVARGERPAGSLLIRGEGARARLSIGPAALTRGVLLGRDGRCGALGFPMPADVSRVHALVLALDGDVVIADAGSTNGTWDGPREVRVSPMRSGHPFLLGQGAIFVEWVPAN